MQRTLFLFALIISCVTLASGQTAVKHLGDVQADSSNAATQCLGEQLSLRHVGDDAAMGGYRAVDFAFTNRSTSPCTLKGYPRLQLLSRSGRPVRGSRIVKSDKIAGTEENQSPQLITLEHDKAAWFRVVYNNGGAGHVGKPCPTYPKVKVTAPGTRRGFVRREDIQSCREIEVSAVQSGLPNE